MSKRELIDAIIQHNRTASPEFLSKFAEQDLKAYLDRMNMTLIPRPGQRVKFAVDSHQPLVMV
jgi:hypothetical protein